MNNYGTAGYWDRIKKLSAVLVAIALWLFSGYFSVFGFNFKTEQSLGFDVATIFGILLAVGVTVGELIMNSDVTQMNLTLYIMGIVCYLYGIYSNIIGIYALNPDGGWILPVLVGLFIEVFPEPVFLWGIGAGRNGDFLGNLFRGQKRMDKWTSQDVTRSQPLKSITHNPQSLNKVDLERLGRNW